MKYEYLRNCMQYMSYKCKKCNKQQELKIQDDAKTTFQVNMHPPCPDCGEPMNVDDMF